MFEVVGVIVGVILISLISAGFYRLISSLCEILENEIKEDW